MDIQAVPLVEVVKAVEGLAANQVRGCEPGDVRDVVVHLNCRLVTMRRAVGRLGVPWVTLRDEYALEVLLKALRTMATGNELWVVERAVEHLDGLLTIWRGKREKGRWNWGDARALEMVMRLFSVLVTRSLPVRSGPVGQNR